MFEKAIINSVCFFKKENSSINNNKTIVNFKTNMLETLSYAYKITLSLIQNRKFRNAILKLLVKLYSSSQTPDYVNVIQVNK